MNESRHRELKLDLHGKVLKSGISEHVLICICSALGLACLFGGIWIGDAQFEAALASSHAMLVMRVSSFIVYALFLLIVIKRTENDMHSMEPFFIVTVGVGLACFAAAVACLLLAVPTLGADASRPLIWAAFALSKVIGAPASIGLVCVFSQLGRKLTLRMASVGILGAFLVYSLVSQAVPASQCPSVPHLAFSSTLILAACLLGMVGLNKRTFGTVKLAHGGAQVRGVVKRPLGAVATPGLLILLVLSAVTLGFLRSGYISGNAHMQPVSIAMLVALVLVLLLCKSIRIEHLFYAALTCTAASILLLPILSAATTDAAYIFTGTGTALFEVVVWVYAVWTARNAAETLLAAALTRAATVTGHLIGTLAVGIGIWLAPDAESIANVSGMLIMFIYIILLLVILKNPGMKAPVMTIESTEDSFYAQSAPSTATDIAARAENAGKAEPRQNQTAEEQVHGKDYERLYWEQPINTLAKTYRLTPREVDVLSLVARGHSLASVEEDLYISHNTVKMHMRNIYTKLEVHSRQDVISLVELVRAQQG